MLTTVYVELSSRLEAWSFSADRGWSSCFFDSQLTVSHLVLHLSIGQQDYCPSTNKSLSSCKFSLATVPKFSKMSEIQPTKTITYKSVGKLDIPLDLYLPPNANKVYANLCLGWLLDSSTGYVNLCQTFDVDSYDV